MARKTPRPKPTKEHYLPTLYRECPRCGRRMWFAYENRRTVTTLEAVVRLKLPIRRCVNRQCERYHVAYRPEEEGHWALPKHEFGLDVIAWIGALRYQSHGTRSEIHRRLCDRGVAISERTVTNLLARYDELASLAQGNRERLRQVLGQQGRLIIAIDGLQPDKGHEVLWVVREVLSGELLAVESLLSSNQAALEGVLRQALEGLEVTVSGVISDGEEAIRKAVARVLPGVAHQLCHYHYLREATRPIWEADRHAKKELKRHLRGVRPIERQVEGDNDKQAEAVRGYCAAVRSALTDDGQPPLALGGLRLRERLSSLGASLERVAEKGGAANHSNPCSG